MRICTSDKECDNGVMGLTCRTSNVSCDCPSTVGIGHCDCVRNASNENFWNCTSCEIAKIRVNSSTTYMCKYMKERTSCTLSSPGNFTCNWTPLMFFHPDIFNQTSLNSNCSSSHEACRMDLGLSCKNETFQCN